MVNPDELLRGPVADIMLDLGNPLILEVGTHDYDYVEHRP